VPSGTSIALIANVANRDLFVIGSSLGGVEALLRLLSDLPADLDATLFIAQHTSPRIKLERVLARRARLPVRLAVDGDAFDRGTIYVAPPDRHLLVEAKTTRVVRGPRENGVRPAIDPLFRSAAAHHGPRVVGIVLTGLREDGTVGLQAIARSGGRTVVQDPDDAAYPEMPRGALAALRVDHVVPLSRMAALISELAAQPAPDDVGAPDDIVREARITGTYQVSDAPLDRIGRVTTFDCPECGGPIWEIGDEGSEHYRCRIGHAYSVQALGDLQADRVERSLLVAMRMLGERSRWLQRMVDRRPDSRDSARMARERDEALGHVEVLKELLSSLS
jgi:two-component system chemotaxis response regulator CheB